MNLTSVRKFSFGLGTTFVVSAFLLLFCVVGSAGAAGPTNDNFADATPLSGSPLAVRGITVGATQEVGEPAHGQTGGRSVWYRWTATEDRAVRISACNTDFDAMVTAYTGSTMESLSLVRENERCAVGFIASAGTTYPILVDSEYDEDGHFVLTVKTYDPPQNDDFTDAVVLNGTEASASTNNVGATLKENEPSYGRGDSSVWYSWTAPTTGDYTIDLCGTEPDLNLVAYTGDSIGNLQQVTASEDGDICGYDPSAHFQVVAGTTYRIRLNGYGQADIGPIMLRLYPGAPKNLNYPFEVKMTGNGSGHVESVDDSSALIDCGDLCISNVDEGDEIKLLAVPDDGSTVVGWEGCAFGLDDFCALLPHANEPYATVEFGKSTDQPVDPSEPEETPGPETPATDLHLKLNTVTIHKNNGTATISAFVNQAAGLKLSGGNIKVVKAKTDRARSVKLKVVTKGGLLKRLRKSGRVSAKVTIAASNGEQKVTRKRTVKLRLKRN